MNDVLIGGAWLAVLATGLGGAIVLRAVGVAATYVRDVLHIGAGVWILGWPWWHGAAIPITIVIAVAISVALVPRFARHVRFAARIERSVTGDDEHWGGLVLYTIAYATLTIVGLAIAPFAAAAALLALSFGDGIGGAVGRALGTHHYRAPGGKLKSYEGSAVVACGALAGALLAATLFGVSLGVASALVLGLVAAVAEALAPRGTDNLIVPAAVFLAANLV